MSLCQPIRKRLDAFKQSNPLSKSKSFTQSNDWQVGSLFKSLCYWEIDKSFVILVFLILLTVTVCVTIVCTYFLLNAEDYRWKIKINHIGFTKIFFYFLLDGSGRRFYLPDPQLVMSTSTPFITSSSKQSNLMTIIRTIALQRQRRGDGF